MKTLSMEQVLTELDIRCPLCGGKLGAQHINPPIPIRSHDYSVTCLDCYSGDSEDPMGNGATVAGAVNNFLGECEGILESESNPFTWEA